MDTEVSDLSAALDHIADRRADRAVIDLFVGALVRGEAAICGARVRLEWVDPKPAVVDVAFPALTARQRKATR